MLSLAHLCSRALASAFAVAVSTAAASAQLNTLNAFTGAPNDNGSASWAMLFDLTAASQDVAVRALTSANSALPSWPFSVEVFVHSGSGLSGAGASSAGWTSLGTAPATQGPVLGGVSLPIDIPDILVPAGQTVGVAIKFIGIGPRYYVPPSGGNVVYADANLSMVTGEMRSALFTTGGLAMSPRLWTGSIMYEFPPTPTAYCTAGTSTHGCSATISATALPSASLANSCVIHVANVEALKTGLLFYGIDNTGFTPLPWAAGSSSFLCVKPPTQRMLVQSSGGTAGQCDGSLSQDWNLFQTAYPAALGHPFSAGDTVFAQAWYRDPPAPKTTQLSNALQLVLVP